MSSMTERDRGATEDAVVAALVELYRKRERARQGGGRPGGQGAPGTYTRVLQHFEKRGQRLRGERLVTEELLGRLVGAARALPPMKAQQELSITGPLGGVAAGRFRIVNDAPVPVTLEMVVGEPIDGGFRPPLTFEMSRPGLQPGEACLVRVCADLAGLSQPAACEVAVECRAGGRRDRLWLRVSAFAVEEQRT